MICKILAFADVSRMSAETLPWRRSWQQKPGHPLEPADQDQNQNQTSGRDPCNGNWNFIKAESTQVFSSGLISPSLYYQSEPEMSILR